MKRAVIRKVKQLRKENLVVLQIADEGDLMQLISKHYNRHPSVCLNYDVRNARSDAVSELDAWFSSRVAGPIKEYLLENWYCENMFRMWGRMHPTKIPIAKTTVMVESHWSQLKQLYILPYNRPRWDFLIYILDVKVLPKFISDYGLLCSGSKKPSWWRHFVVEWNRASTRLQNNTYRTNLSYWTCNCNAFLFSRFMMCKHLTSGASCPEYRDVVRSRHPPFLTIRREPNCYRARIVGEFGDTSQTLVESSPVQVAMIPPLEPLQKTGTNNLTENSRDNQGDAENLLLWTLQHVRELGENDAGARQVEYVSGNVLRRLRTYRSNLQANLAARFTPGTWSEPDTLYLP